MAPNSPKASSPASSAVVAPIFEAPSSASLTSPAPLPPWSSSGVGSFGSTSSGLTVFGCPSCTDPPSGCPDGVESLAFGGG